MSPPEQKGCDGLNRRQGIFDAMFHFIYKQLAAHEPACYVKSSALSRTPESMHYHYAALTHAMARRDESSGAMPDAGRSFSRAKRRVEVQAAA